MGLNLPFLAVRLAFQLVFGDRISQLKLLFKEARGVLWDVWGLFRPLAGGLHHSRLVSIRIRHLFITSFCYISLMCNCKMFYATQFLPLPWESRHIYFGHIYRAILSGFSYTALHRLIVGTNTCNLQGYILCRQGGIRLHQVTEASSVNYSHYMSRNVKWRRVH